MRVLFCFLAIGLVTGCVATVKQQSNLVARLLSIPPDEVELIVREARERHKMKVAWVRTSGTAIEVRLGRKDLFNPGASSSSFADAMIVGWKMCGHNKSGKGILPLLICQRRRGS